MGQEKIWDYLQNEGAGLGHFSEARQRYLINRISRGAKVLNIGVGAGQFERLALAARLDVFSLDPSERAIEKLRTDTGLDESRAKAGYAQDMPFKPETFDVVVMSEVLEHLEDHVLGPSLEEVRRVLRPGGQLIATTPYRENLGLAQVVCPECGNVFHRMGHHQSFDLQKMKKLLEENGFIIRRAFVTAFVDWHRPGIRNLVKSIARFALGRMGEGISDPHIVAIGVATRFQSQATRRE